MLYVFTGNDGATAKREVYKRAPGGVLLFGEGGDDVGLLPARLASPGLFSETHTFLLDRPFETDDGARVLLEHLDLLCDSPHTVFIIENALDAKTKKQFPKKTSFETFDTEKETETPRPNVFSFTDTVLRRDRKGAWLSYQKLLRAGVSPEEVHGALSWAVRSTLLAAKTKSATDAGLKPFVYTKSKRAAEKTGVAHFENLSRSLMSVYHRARGGEGELSLGLEKLLLEKT